MTYRDDHDAAIARATSLADDLKRAEAERDRLREQVAQLEKVEPLRAEPPVALAPSRPEAITVQEIGELVAALADGAKQIRVLKTVRVVGSALLILAGLATCFAAPLVPALFVVAVGVVALVISSLADDGDHASIIETVRHRPQEIVEIRERATTKGNLWVTITARDGTWARFSPRAATAFVVALARRCRAAKLS